MCRRLHAAAALAAALACSSCGAPAAPDSLATSLREADCHAPAPEVAAPYTRRDLGVQECPAASGWRLLLVSSDANSWLDVNGPGVTWSAERAVVYDEPIGLFPGLDTGATVEWRRNGSGDVTALIVPLVAQDKDALTTRQSRRLVVRVTGTTACVLGRVTTDADARSLADSARGC